MCPQWPALSHQESWPWLGRVAQSYLCTPVQVFLNSSQGQIYHSQQVGSPGSAIMPDLLVDSNGDHLYVLTAQQVRPVSEVEWNISK